MMRKLLTLIETNKGSTQPIPRIKLLLLVIAALFFSNSAQAADTPDSPKNNLAKISSSIKSLQGDFTQFEYNERGRPLRVLEGEFRMTDKLQLWWQIDPPYAQTIISNGTHSMIYDDDLQQLIIRNLDKDNLPPFFFLANNPQLLDAMKVAQPDESEPTFFLSDDNVEIFVRFDKRTPAEISWKNELNQRITIQLDNLVRNRRIAKRHFSFTPPAGTDIVRD